MVVGIARVKDEADIITSTVHRMLRETDRVIVVDNASTDGTRDLLADIARDDDRLIVRDDPEVAYFQSRQMTRLADVAAGLGADWVVPFDADEAWYSPFGRIADVLTQHPEAAVAAADVYDHVATAIDPADESDPLRRTGWRRRQAGELVKVACRPRLPVTIHQGNHAATYPAGTLEGLLVVRHYPYRTAEQMTRKARNGAAAYAATDLPEHEGKHWRDYGRLTDEQLADTFRTWFWSPAPERDTSLIYDPCP